MNEGETTTFRGSVINKRLLINIQGFYSSIYDIWTVIHNLLKVIDLFY